MALDGAIDIVISQSIMDETLCVLREKFGAQQPELDRALTIMETVIRKVEPTITLNVVKDDPKDNHVIECAVAAGADVIVTGDRKHLLKMGSYEGIRMMQVSEFLQRQIGK